MTEPNCLPTAKDGLAVVVYLICMSMIATISWYNYQTSSKLEVIIHDIQKREIVGSGADYVYVPDCVFQTALTTTEEK